MAYLCLAGMFAPERLIEEQERDNAARRHYSDPGRKEHSAYLVRRAFWRSLGLVIVSTLLGAVAGRGLRAAFGPLPTRLSWVPQVIAVEILLWGTLFVRGWDIGTFSGVTLVERVNQCLYRALYLVGTAILVLSLTWA